MEESGVGRDERLFLIDLNPNCFGIRLCHKTRLMNKDKIVKNRFPLTFQKANVINLLFFFLSFNEFDTLLQK